MMIFTNMRLQEDINRIKQVMGINESIPSTIKRKLDILPNYIRSTYKWLDPKAFLNFDDYIERVIFSSTRDFIADNHHFTNYDEYEKIADELYGTVRTYINENLMEEIMGYFVKSRGESSDKLKPYMGINEEHEEPTHAVIEVLHGVPYMTDKYRYQVVPYPATKEDEVNIKKGPSKDEAVSKKYIKVLKTGSKNDMKDHISKLKEKSSAEWIKCKNCRKKFTQTIHKGKKSLPICPTCGTHN